MPLSTERTVKVALSGMLGKYPSHDGFAKLEFQIGKILVWVRLRPDEEESEFMARSNLMLPGAWSEIPEAISFAEGHSRKMIPDFWVAQGNTTATGQRLAVWSIMLTPETGEICYHVSCNHDFFWSIDKTFSVLDVDQENPIDLPEFPKGHYIDVLRSPTGAWSVASAA